MLKKISWSVVILSVIISCNPVHRAARSLKHPSVNLDTISISASKEPPVYHGSETLLYDIIHTRLEVNFDWSKCWMYGKATITAKPYFYPLNSVTLDARGFEIHEVALVKKGEKVKAAYTYKDARLTVELDKEYMCTDSFQIFIDYTAKPNDLKEGGSAAIHSDKGLYFINPDGKEEDKPKQIWTQGETQSNSSWFPTHDVPNEKMTDEIFITVDKKYTTLSNGELVSSKNETDSTRTDHWKMNLPHSPYLVMMAVGEFEITKDKWRDREVSYYLEKEYAPYAKAIFGNTPEMIEFFSTRLGVPYAWNKYSQIVVRDYVSGAMENTTATLHGEAVQLTDRELIDNDHEDVISHELFHQWFGDLATAESWSNIPLNESFATYGEYLWIEYKYGRQEADQHLQEDLDAYMAEATRKQVNLIRYYYSDREEVFDGHSYQKGGRVLHMLRKYVGDEAFFASLKLYLETNKFKNVEVCHLRLAFEQVTGEDLNWFFNQWFFSSGHPQLDIKYSYDEMEKKETVSIHQDQDLTKTPLFKLPVLVDIYANGKVRTEKIVITKAAENFVFDVSSRPDLVNVDAEKMLLCAKDETKTRKEWTYQFFHAPLYLDRDEALTEIIKNPKDSIAAKVMLAALDDKFWNIRYQVIPKLKELNPSLKEQVKNKLAAIARTDAKSLVRARALHYLNTQYKDTSLTALYRDAMKEKSYAVLSEALNGISKSDPKEALKIAKDYESEKNRSILLGIASLYADNGSDENNDFFMKLGSKLHGYSRASYLSHYSVFLKRCKDETINTALPVIEEIAHKDKNKFVRYYAMMTIRDLSTMYEKKEDELKPKITELKNKKDTGGLKTAQEELVKVLEQEKKLQELYKSVLKDNM